MHHSTLCVQCMGGTVHPRASLSFLEHLQILALPLPAEGMNPINANDIFVRLEEDVVSGKKLNAALRPYRLEVAIPKPPVGPS